MASLVAARAAKESLRQQLVGQPWFRGIGITQTKCMGPDPYVLQVNVATRDAPRLYPVWMGVPVTTSVVGNISALGVTVTAQDYANVFIGFAVLFGTFMVGKIAVESIVASRREHFDSKGQPPEAVKSKETAVDGIVKLVAFALSVNEVVTEGPALLAEVRKYLP